MSHDTIAIGAPGHDGGTGSDAGAVYLFRRNLGASGGTTADGWGELTVLAPGDATAGDFFGAALDLDVDLLVVGAFGKEDASGTMNGVGAAYVFERNRGGADAWGELTTIASDLPQPDGSFGAALAISDETIAVGEPLHDGPGAQDMGAVLIFERNQGGPTRGARSPASLTTTPRLVTNSVPLCP